MAGSPAPAPAPTRDVVIVYPATKMVDTPFNVCLAQLLVHDSKHNQRVSDVLCHMSSPRIAETRNQLVSGALEVGATWVLTLDTDMTFPPDALDQLLEVADQDERPIVSGLYFGGKPEGPAHSHAYLADPATGAYNPVEGLAAVGDWDGIGQVSAVGAGIVLMHKGALITIGEAYKETGYPWFVEAVRVDEAGKHHQIGEDIAFCMRAEKLGIPIHCLFELACGHVKMGVVDQRTHRAFRHAQDLGWTELDAAQDYGARFHFAGFKTLPEQNEARVEMVEKTPLTVESLLGANGARK